MSTKKKQPESGTYNVSRHEAIAKFMKINPDGTHLKYTPTSEIYDVKELHETLVQHESDDEPRPWYISEGGITHVDEHGHESDSGVEYLVHYPAAHK